MFSTIHVLSYKCRDDTAWWSGSGDHCLDGTRCNRDLSWGRLWWIYFQKKFQDAHDVYSLLTDLLDKRRMVSGASLGNATPGGDNGYECIS